MHPQGQGGFGDGLRPFSAFPNHRRSPISLGGAGGIGKINLIQSGIYLSTMIGRSVGRSVGMLLPVMVFPTYTLSSSVCVRVICEIATTGKPGAGTRPFASQFASRVARDQNPTFGLSILLLPLLLQRLLLRRCVDVCRGQRS